jgi:hypothetical protein
MKDKKQLEELAEKVGNLKDCATKQAILKDIELKKNKSVTK